MKEEEFLNYHIKDNDTGLFVEDTCIMFKWEKPVIQESIKEICERVKPKSVLEIGFGYGYTAEQFQKCGVGKHIIIEPHPEIYKKALEWASKRPCKCIIILNSFWQDVDLPHDEFDLVYYDAYELVFQDSISWTTKFKTKWVSEVFIDGKDNREGFKFKVEGKEYFQPLIKNNNKGFN